MSEKAQFEGMIRICGSIPKVEKALAALKKAGVEVVDNSFIHPHWHPRFPDCGMPVPVEVGMFLRDPKFVKGRLTAFNKKVPNKSQMKISWGPDLDIWGGRKYHHLHLGNKILPVTEKAFGALIKDGLMEVRKLGGGNTIG